MISCTSRLYHDQWRTSHTHTHTQFLRCRTAGWASAATARVLRCTTPQTRWTALCGDPGISLEERRWVSGADLSDDPRSLRPQQLCGAAPGPGVSREIRDLRRRGHAAGRCPRTGTRSPIWRRTRLFDQPGRDQCSPKGKQSDNGAAALNTSTPSPKWRPPAGPCQATARLRRWGRVRRWLNTGPGECALLGWMAFKDGAGPPAKPSRRLQRNQRTG